MKFIHVSPVKSTYSRTPRNKFESKSKSPRKTKRSLWYDDCSDVTSLTPQMRRRKGCQRNIIYSDFLSFSRYCTRSCLTMMAGVGVAHKLLKTNKKKITVQIFDRATIVYLEAVLKDRHTKPCPCPTLGHYVLDLNPSTVSAETASVVSLFQVAIVLGKK